MEFYDVSNWIRMSASSTKGTRDKLVLIDPKMGDICFLKFPMVRERETILQKIGLKFLRLR